MQKCFKLLRICKAAGNMRFLLVITFPIVPATVGCPVHNLREGIIDLCEGNGNLITLHAAIALIEFLFGLMSEIMTGRIACFKGEDAIRSEMPLHGCKQSFLIFAAQESLKGISSQQDEPVLHSKLEGTRVSLHPADIQILFFCFRSEEH